MVAWFTRLFAPEARGHGVPEVISAVARHDGIVRPRVALVKILASGFCIGTGGSVGREGPIVQIGAALGSSAGQWFGLAPRHIKVLVAAGAAAGISATFNAPIAGVIFVSEIILGNFAVESLTPIVIASVLANVVQIQVGEHGMSAAFSHIRYVYEGVWAQIPSFVAIGILCGLAAVAFTKLVYRIEDIGQRLIPSWWCRALAAELAWLLPLALLKPLLTSLTLAGGGSGGIFAPSLFIGATLGASFGIVCNLFIPGVSAHPGLYAIVGMGAVVAGTTHGVLSAILIVYELTDDYRIILPIMVAAGLASLISSFIDPESIYQKKLSRRGEQIARGHDAQRLEHVMVRDVMIRTFPTVRDSDNVNEIIRVARANTHIEGLPVVNDEDRLIGIIRPEDLRRVLDGNLQPQLICAEDIAARPPLAVAPDENLLEALRDFGTRDVETLPVEIGTGSSRRLIGLLARADVMRRYRKEILRQ